MAFLNPFRRKKNNDMIVIVSGLPRSGTSMMMKMLEAGGLDPLIDNIRTADEDNPKGYYEFERVKQVKTDQAWLDEAKGKVVKVISMLLLDMPPTHQYKVIFMRRAMPEILASQQKMLVRRNEPTDKVDDATLSQLYEKHLAQVDAWMKTQANVDFVYVKYDEVLSDPQTHAEMINAFLDDRLDVEAMVGVVDPKLYRQRKA